MTRMPGNVDRWPLDRGIQMASKGSGDGKSLIQVAFPGQPTVVFFTAIALGVALVGSSTAFRHYFALNGIQSDLVLCIGCALVLAAFGGQATVKVGGVIMAGAAALALGLFVYLNNISDALFVRGTLYPFDYDKYVSLDMKHRNRVLGRIDQDDTNTRRSRYDFVLFKDEIQGETIEVIVIARENDTEHRLSISVTDVAWAFGHKGLIEWELREVLQGQETVLTLFERARRKEIAREGTVLVSNRPPEAGATAWAPINWMPVALAAGIPQKIDVPLMLQRLTSADPSTRRDARTALSYARPDDIPAIMQAFARQGGDYRVKLGVCAALSQMLRRDHYLAPALAKQLGVDDIGRFLDAAGDRDATVRSYATEFLVALRDPRASSLAISRAGATKDDSARYNWLLVAQSAWAQIPSDEKRALSPMIQQARQAAGSKTKPMLDKLK
jgi:hypothetical protein